MGSRPDSPLGQVLPDSRSWRWRVVLPVLPEDVMGVSWASFTVSVPLAEDSASEIGPCSRLGLYCLQLRPVPRTLREFHTFVSKQD